MPLIIGKKGVIKLSGSTSMNILYPNDVHLQDFPNAPIFIVFGDYHFSNKKYCDPIENESKGHYKIDGGFLQLLSNAVNPDDIVDFYLEGGPFHRKLDEGKDTWPEKTPMNDLWKVFNACYDNIRMGREPAKDSGCDKIKNIRWQASDIRFFGDYGGYQVLDHYLMPIIIKDSQSVDKDHRDEYFMGRFIGEIMLSSYFENYSKTLLIERDAFINKILGAEILQSANEGKNEIVKEKIEKYNASLIHKQLKRIDPKFDRLKKNLRSLFENYINDEYKKINQGFSDLFGTLTFEHIQSDIMGLYYSHMTGEFDLFKGSILSHFNTGALSYFLQKTGYLFTLIPDLYILARSYKNMLKIGKMDEEVKYPLINVIYYGDYHAINLCDYLKKNGYMNEFYTKTFINSTSQRVENVSRCLEFKTDTNLDAMISKLSNYRTKIGNSRWAKMKT